MVISDIVLYIMSGTGNTYRVAQWVQEIAEGQGIQTQALMIDGVTKENRPAIRKDRLFGLMFPAHGLMVPWSMLKFLFQMPWGKGSQAIFIATRGGIKAGPVIIPGVVGLGNFIAALILTLKGYRVKGWFSLDMPTNMINLHWGMKRENAMLVIKRAREKIVPIVHKALNGKMIIYPRNTMWDLFWGVGLLWLVPVFPILYLTVGKLFMAKLMFSDNRCIGCGLCAKFCPNQAITMKKIGQKRRPFWTFHCEACLRCMGFCKRNAAVAGHSWGVLLYFITTVPFITYFLNQRELYQIILSGVSAYWLRYLLQIINIVPALILSYWVFWLLMQIPLINTLFSYTTLTRYFRRYHEPDTKLKNLKKNKIRKSV